MIQNHIRELFGDDVCITGRRPMAGGDINVAFCLDLSDGRKVFLKTNRPEREDMFSAEAEGLAALAAANVIPVVQPLGSGRNTDCSYLLLTYIQEATPSPTFWEDFGRDLARLHRQNTESCVRNGRFGFLHNNYIGRTRQSNAPHETFISFFRQERLHPQIMMARRYFDNADLSRLDHILDHLDDLLIEPAFPSLLHGDLWSGNFLVGKDGRAVLIDPAVWVGCAEADLAMTELFGGFSPRFYAAYREAFPLQYGYEDRRDLYNLYHLLNHLNLFGRGYLTSVRQIIKRFG